MLGLFIPWHLEIEGTWQVGRGGPEGAVSKFNSMFKTLEQAQPKVLLLSGAINTGPHWGSWKRVLATPSQPHFPPTYANAPGLWLCSLWGQFQAMFPLSRMKCASVSSGRSTDRWFAHQRPYQLLPAWHTVF